MKTPFEILINFIKTFIYMSSKHLITNSIENETLLLQCELQYTKAITYLI